MNVLEDSLLLRPRDAHQRTRLGEIYQKIGKHADALAAFRRAVKDEPEYAPAHAALGAFLAERGDWAEAEASLNEAIRLKADLVSPYVTLAQEYAKRSNFAKASECYAAALTLKPDMVTLLRGAAVEGTRVLTPRLGEVFVPSRVAGPDPWWREVTHQARGA